MWSILYWECVSCTENQIKYTIYVPIIIIIIISLFAVVLTTHLKIKIQTNNEKVKSLKIKS